MDVAVTEIFFSLGALVLLSLIVVPAGALIAGSLDFPGFAGSTLVERAGLGLICGFGCLPVLLDYAARLGPQPMAAAALSLAVLGAPFLLPSRTGSLARPRAGWIVGAALWVILAFLLIVDMPGAGLPGRSVLAADYVKHATVTWSLVESGAPPWNPTVYEPGRAMSYYYLFYTLPAAAALLGAAFGVEARHVAYACAPLIGFALFALARSTLERSGAREALGDPGRPRATAAWLAALLLTTGFDFVFMVILVFVVDGDIGQAARKFFTWDEQVTSWFNTSIWVPHHAAALCAAIVGFVSLSAPEHKLRRVALAALAFASMAGMSVYVAASAALGAFIWLLSLLWRRRLADAARLCLAGAVALALAAPWLLTLAGRIGGGEPLPIEFRLRGPEWIDIIAGSPEAGALYRGLSMPFFYLAEFGVFALGAFAFWREAGRRGFSNELGLILLCLTLASFLVASFWRSTILFNDLGWRSMLFAQFAALVWTTAAATQGALFRGRLRSLAIASLAIGYAGTAGAAAQLRFAAPWPAESATLVDEMAAWRWLDSHLPRGAVVQARPEQKRAFAYGLYGRFPVAIADRHNGRLFGAGVSEINARFEAVSPIFSDATLSMDEARRRAASYEIAALVVSCRDPVFAAPGAWPASVAADYANPSFRIYLVRTPRS